MSQQPMTPQPEQLAKRMLRREWENLSPREPGARTSFIGSGRLVAYVITWTSRDGVLGIRVPTGVGATDSQPPSRRSSQGAWGAPVGG
jgi:hypothetical protein